MSELRIDNRAGTRARGDVDAGDQGVEVCGCPPEEVQQRHHADELQHDLAKLEEELKDLKHEPE